MNTMMTKFIRQGGLNRMPFRLEEGKNKYEAFINGSFANNSNVASLQMEQRNYETNIKKSMANLIYKKFLLKDITMSPIIGLILQDQFF